MLDKVGIKVKVKPVESSVLSRQPCRAAISRPISGRNTSGPDPLTALKCFYSKTPQASCNYTKFKNPDYDKLIDEAAPGRDGRPSRSTCCSKANNLLQEEAPVWFFNYNKAVMAYQPWLHGLQPNATELAIQSYEELWVDDTAPAR